MKHEKLLSIAAYSSLVFFLAEVLIGHMIQLIGQIERLLQATMRLF